MINKQTMKQRGFFKCGAGINKRQWIDSAQVEGYCTLDCGDHVEMWSAMTPAERSAKSAE